MTRPTHPAPPCPHWSVGPLSCCTSICSSTCIYLSLLVKYRGKIQVVKCRLIISHHSLLSLFKGSHSDGDAFRDILKLPLQKISYYIESSAALQSLLPEVCLLKHFLIYYPFQMLAYPAKHTCTHWYIGFENLVKTFVLLFEI